MAISSLATLSVPAYKGNYTKGRSQKINKITLHHMAGVLTAKACGKIWQDKKRKASSNYGIGNDAVIASYVDEADTSWCDGNWDSNCKSITIEVSNSIKGGNWVVSDAVLEQLIKLVADIAKRNKLGTLVKGKNFTWHSMYSATSCPGPYLLSKIDYIIEEANKINSTVPKTETSKKESFLPSRGYFKKGDKGNNVKKINDFYYTVFPGYAKKLGRKAENVKGNLFGSNTLAWTKEFQRRTGLVVDGYIGPLTLAKMKQYGLKY